MSTYLFVYGTLMSGLRNHHLLKPFMLRAVPARAEGLLLYPVHPEWPGAVPGPGSIRGELVELDRARLAEALAVLDELEDCHGPGDPASLYVRSGTEAVTESGEPLQAWIYLWAHSIEDLEPICGGDWRLISPEG